MYRLLRCPTWIRTKTNRTKICRTTIILSGSFPFLRGCKNTLQDLFSQIGFSNVLKQPYSVTFPDFLRYLTVP